MNHAELEENIEKIFKLLKDIRCKKNHDYGNEDPLSNLRISKLMGMPPWKGTLIRISDKFARLCSFSEKGSFKVNDEGFRDTVLDLLNYTLFLYILYNDEVNKNG